MATDEDYLEIVTSMRYIGLKDDKIRQVDPKFAEALDKLDKLNRERKDVRPKPAPRGSGPSACPPRPKLSL